MKEAGVEVLTDIDRKAFSDALGSRARYVPERQPAGRRSPESRGRGAISHEQLLAGVRLWWELAKSRVVRWRRPEVAVQRLPLHALSPQPLG